MHELMHGLGPQTIRVGGRDTTVRQELKELNGPLEEAKADISGLWALQYLMDKGVIDKKQERSMYVTFLASTFRTLRFGLNESHAKGMALQMNYLDGPRRRARLQGRAVLTRPAQDEGGGRRAHARHHDACRRTATTRASRTLLDRMVVIRPEVQRVIDRLTDVPVDIAPRFVTAEELTRQ